MADRPTEPIPPGGDWGQPPQQGPPAGWGAPPPPRPPRPPSQLPWWRRPWAAGLIWGVVGFVAGAAAGGAGATTRRRVTTTTRAPTRNCHPSYPDFCIPPPPPDLNCPDIGETDFTVQGTDPHGFDGDNDGVGWRELTPTVVVVGSPDL